MTQPPMKQPDKFTDFMRRLMAVPHSEIKARIEARKQTIKTASPVRSALRPNGQLSWPFLPPCQSVLYRSDAFLTI